MQSNIERIESSFIVNFHLSANTMSTSRIKDDPYFQTNHLEQLIDALNLLVKQCLLRGRRIFCISKSGQSLPFYIADNKLIYRDPLIKVFLNNWLKLETVDRTFFLIDSQRKYEEEYEKKMQRDLIQLDELLA